MQLAILNGNPEPADNAFDEYVGQLADLLTARGHNVTRMLLREMNIKACVGCFSCWVKTPGECVATDDAVAIRRAWMASDLALLASPVRMGFYSSLLKKCVDKLLPIILPYGMFVQGESHHVGRYDRYPRIALLLQRGDDTDDEDLAILNAIVEREALNLKTCVALSVLTDRSVGEVADAIDHL